MDWMLVVLPLLAVPIVLLFRFMGCPAFGETVAFSLKVDPPAGVSIDQGATAHVATVTIQPFGTPVPYNADTGLESKITNGPAGVIGTFQPQLVKLSIGETQSKVFLTADSSAAPGARTLTITGTGGGLSHAATLNLTVNAVAPGFSLQLNPDEVTVMRGTTPTVTVQIIISRVGGFGGAVHLAAPTLPGVQFVPQDTTLNASELRVTRTVPTAAPTGPQTFDVTGTSGSLSDTKQLTITVQ